MYNLNQTFKMQSGNGVGIAKKCFFDSSKKFFILVYLNQKFACILTTQQKNSFFEKEVVKLQNEVGQLQISTFRKLQEKLYKSSLLAYFYLKNSQFYAKKFLTPLKFPFCHARLQIERGNSKWRSGYSFY